MKRFDLAVKTSTSVVETPAAAMATAAKTAVWVWRPTPGPCRKSKGVSMALVTLLPQLRQLDYQGAQNRDESTGGADAGQETSGAKYLSKSDGNGVMAEHRWPCSPGV